MQVFERTDSYRILETEGIERIIPKDPANSDYQTLLEWIAEGGEVGAEQETIAHAPSWTAFRLPMMLDAGYDRLARAVFAVDPIAQSRLETVIMADSPHLPTVQMLWGVWINHCPPTAAEIEQFQKYAADSNVPIGFEDNGAIELG